MGSRCLQSPAPTGNRETLERHTRHRPGVDHVAVKTRAAAAHSNIVPATHPREMVLEHKVLLRLLLVVTVTHHVRTRDRDVVPNIVLRIRRLDPEARKCEYRCLGPLPPRRDEGAQPDFIEDPWTENIAVGQRYHVVIDGQQVRSAGRTCGVLERYF